MTGILLDTCVVIDILRQKSKAIDYLESLVKVPALSAPTVTELYAGVRGTKEQRILAAIVETSTVIHLDVKTAKRAGELLAKYRPSHGLDAIDAMIAATAEGHDLQLATINLKHFPMFEGLQRPY